MTHLQRRWPVMVAVLFALLSVGLMWQGIISLLDGETWPGLFNVGASLYWGWMVDTYWRKWRRRSEPEGPQAEPAD